MPGPNTHNSASERSSKAPPKLRRHVRGQFFVRIAGRDHWLGTDEQLARERHADLIDRIWRPAQERRRVRVEAPLGRTTVADAAAMMFEHYDANRPATVGGGGGSGYWRRHLARFLAVHGRQRLLDLAMPEPTRGTFLAPVIPLLTAMVTDLTREGLGPRTIRHDLTAVQRLFNFAAEQGLCPKIDFGPVQGPRARRAPEVRLTQRQVTALLLRARRRDDRLTPWLALTYLCCARPSEIVTLVHAVHAPSADASGRWHTVHDEHSGKPLTDLVYELDQHKTVYKVDAPRHLIVPPTARAWLAQARPHWSRLDSFSQAAMRLHWPTPPGSVSGAKRVRGPKLVQQSAATHLRHAGVEREGIDRALGHAGSAMFETYARASLARLAAQMEQHLAPAAVHLLTR